MLFCWTKLWCALLYKVKMLYNLLCMVQQQCSKTVGCSLQQYFSKLLLQIWINLECTTKKIWIIFLFLLYLLWTLYFCRFKKYQDTFPPCTNVTDTSTRTIVLTNKLVSGHHFTIAVYRQRVRWTCVSWDICSNLESTTEYLMWHVSSIFL